MIFEFKPGAEAAGARLDIFLKNRLPYTRRIVQKAIKAGLCKINAVTCENPAKKLRQKDEIVCEIPETGNSLAEEENETEIVWEDKDLLVCNKPAGLTVHPCISRQENTLVQQLLSVHPELAKMAGNRPGIAHRLDKDTSGLLVIALNEQIRLLLMEEFARREINKEYLCLVKGLPPKTGRIEKAVGRDPAAKIKMAILPENRGGKPARTSWQVLQYFSQGDFSLLRVKIYTGRTHQIRVHLADSGYPLLGDRLYAPHNVASMADRQMLHAWKLDFTHPATFEKLHFSHPPPQDFLETIMNNAYKKPLIIVTGKPGSGKSAVTAVLAEEGFPAISADAVIADLYSAPSALIDWLKINGACDLLDEKEQAIIKPKLLARFQESPSFRLEFEKYAHALVFDEILSFQEAQAKINQRAVVAEIPLYFEKGWQELFKPRPICIGVSCEREIRWQRLKETRDWDAEKITFIDQLQWSQQKKLAQCDLVIENNGSREDLILRVNDAIKKISALLESNKKTFEQKMLKSLQQT